MAARAPRESPEERHQRKKREFRNKLMARKRADPEREIEFAADRFLELLEGREHLWQKHKAPRSLWGDSFCDCGTSCCLNYYHGACECQKRDTVTYYVFSRMVFCRCCFDTFSFGQTLCHFAYCGRKPFGPCRKYTYLDIFDLDRPALQMLDTILLRDVEDYEFRPPEARAETEAYRARVAARLSVLRA